MRKIPFYAAIIALSPILSLYVDNAPTVPFSDVLRPLVVAALVLAILWLAIYAIVRDHQKAPVIVIIFLVPFLSYRNTISALAVLANQIGLPTGENGYLGPTLGLLWFGASIALAVAGSIAIIRSQRDFQRVHDFLNVLALSLAVVVLVSWLLARASANTALEYAESWRRDVESQTQTDSTVSAPRSLPDIYYIIVDGYARADILKEIYHTDNSEFLSFLAEKGFYVAQDSHSNYAQTALSLASSLNFSYLDELTERLGGGSANRAPLLAMIERSKVSQALQAHGYTTLGFSTGYSLTEYRSADLRWSSAWAISEFENIFIRMTAIPVVLELPFLPTLYDTHRERILFTLAQLPAATQIDSPKFVFAHILAPHPPFVLGATGEYISPEGRLDLLGGFDLDDGTDFASLSGRRDYVQGYTEQLRYVSTRLQAVIEQILVRSPVPPIIILQADHGPGSRLSWESAESSYLPERLSILNAYYFPDGDYGDLYPNITPVNTFRVVLNHYFHKDYTLLDDTSYFSTIDRPYSFYDATEEISSRKLR